MEVRCGLPADWVSELKATSEKPRCKAWDALAAIVFGRAHRNNNVVMEAHRLYGQALPELRTSLSDLAERRADGTLASMTALYTYEVSCVYRLSSSETYAYRF